MGSLFFTVCLYWRRKSLYRGLEGVNPDLCACVSSRCAWTLRLVCPQCLRVTVASVWSHDGASDAETSLARRQMQRRPALCVCMCGTVRGSTTRNGWNFTTEPGHKQQAVNYWNLPDLIKFLMMQSRKKSSNWRSCISEADLKRISYISYHFFIVSDAVSITEYYLKYVSLSISDISWITHKRWIRFYENLKVVTHWLHCLRELWARILLTFVPLQVLLAHRVLDGQVGEEAFVLLLQLSDLGEQVLGFSSPHVLHQLQLLYISHHDTSDDQQALWPLQGCDILHLICCSSVNSSFPSIFHRADEDKSSTDNFHVCWYECEYDFNEDQKSTTCWSKYNRKLGDDSDFWSQL